MSAITKSRGTEVGMVRPGFLSQKSLSSPHKCKAVYRTATNEHLNQGMVSELPLSSSGGIQSRVNIMGHYNSVPYIMGHTITELEGKFFYPRRKCVFRTIALLKCVFFWTKGVFLLLHSNKEWMQHQLCSQAPVNISMCQHGLGCGIGPYSCEKANKRDLYNKSATQADLVS